MDLSFSTTNGILLVELREPRLEAANAQAFKTPLLEAVEQGHERIALDLSKVEFIDSSGIAVLLSALKALRGKGDFVLCGMQERILKIFRITKLDRGVFRFFPDASEALAALAE